MGQGAKEKEGRALCFRHVDSEMSLEVGVLKCVKKGKVELGHKHRAGDTDVSVIM